MEGYQWGGEGGRERMEEKVQEIRSINGRYRVRLRIVGEIEKTKNLYV